MTTNTPEALANNTKPVASMLVFTFNQKDFVAQAVRAALAQTYSPLEIIISDDASVDGTPEIVRKLVEDYSGPHVVRSMFNTSNLGIGAHVSKVLGMARGQFMILAAGDDVSRHDRVERTMKAWEANNRRPSAIFCGADYIDSSGLEAGVLQQSLALARVDARTIASRIYRSPTGLLGACSAYAPDVLAAFGPFPHWLSIEDTPLAVRASLLGGVVMIPDRLVQYRVDSSTWRPTRTRTETFERHRDRLGHLAVARYRSLLQICRDVKYAGNSPTLRAVRSRLHAFYFVTRCYKQAGFSIHGYVKALRYGADWHYALLHGVMFSFPRVHRLIFFTRRAIEGGR